MISKIRCDTNWPICFLDISHSWTVQDQLVFRSDLKIIDDYDGSNIKSNESSPLVYKGKHYCKGDRLANLIGMLCEPDDRLV